MRTIKKTAVMVTSKIRVYDKTDKKEIEVNISHIRGFDVSLGSNQVFLETVDVKEEECEFELSPEEFFRHAACKRRES